MNLKALLLPIVPFALLSTDAFAQSKKRTTTVVESRATYNLYRPIPRGSMDLNKQKARVALFKPTQHYYTRDSVVSYRYTVQAAYGGSVDTGTYLGPAGAVFSPEGEDLPAPAAIRNYATIHRRGQPGVGMAPATTTITTKKTTSARALPTEGAVAAK